MRAWRDPAPPLALDEGTLDAIAPLAIHGGAAGLLLRRLDAAGAKGARVDELRAVYRKQVLDEALLRRGLALVAGAFEQARIRFVLIKGFTAARRYPAPGLRPFCDLDVVVSPEDERAARGVLASLGGPVVPEVDLHARVPHFDPRRAKAALGRLRRLRIGDTEVDALGEEDHLHLLAAHGLIHGLWRPVWLVDLAVAVETRGDGFDWDRLVAGGRRRAQGIACALGLAREVLGADLGGTPFATTTLPSWLLPALFAQWGARYEVRDAMQRLPRRPADLLAEVRRRFNEPIGATAAAGPWNEWPRLPVQIADLALRTLRFLRHGPRVPAPEAGRPRVSDGDSGG